MSRTAAILLAAGQGRRMPASVPDKILAPLGGRPVFAHSAAAFVASGVADFYLVVCRNPAQSLELSAYAPTPALFVRGGSERQDSVAAALAAVPADIDYVFIHDCARPMIRPEQLHALLKVVRRDGAVVLAHRVVDTVKQLPAGAGRPTRVHPGTLDRSRLWAMETPQVFARGLILRAYAGVARRGRRITDDAQAVELLGHTVTFLENPHPNPKLTTAADLGYLEFLLERETEP